MAYEKIGKISFDTDNKLIKRMPTTSNLLATSGSDNDIYLGNITRQEVVEKVCNILNLENIREFNNKIYTMDFYDSDVEIITNINNQGRINIRIYNRNRLSGMINYYNNYKKDKIEYGNFMIVFDFYKMQILFEKYK